MKKYLLLCYTFIGVLVFGCGQGVWAQEPDTTQKEKPAKVWTNDDFGVASTPTPPPVPTKSAEPTKTTTDGTKPATTPSKVQPVTGTTNTPETKEPVAEEPARPHGELQVKKDADGRWILTSKPIIIANKEVAVPFGSLTSSTGHPDYDLWIQEAGQKYGIDPRLILEVMRQESGFNRYATSPAGARGLMQFISGTAKRYGITDPYDPQQSIDAGTRYLRDLLEQFNGDVSLALAGYNAGENRVKQSGYRVPNIRETQNYVSTITTRYRNKQHYVSKNAISKKDEPPPPPPMRVVKGEDGRILLTNR